MQEDFKKIIEETASKFPIGKGGNPDESIKSLKEIKSFSKNDAVALLNYFVEIEKDPKVLYRIVKELGRYKDKRSSSVLIGLIADFKEDRTQYLKIRTTAANILGNLKEEKAVIPLMYIMNDKDEDYRLRLSVAEALGKIGTSDAVMPMIGIISDDDEKSVYLKESATKALGMIGDERAVDPLIGIVDMKENLMGKFSFLREKAVEALGRLNFKKDKRIETLKKVLYDKSPHVRASAVEALAETEEPYVIEYIEPLLKDDNESVVKTTVHAIYYLQGEEYLERLLGRDNLSTTCRVEIEELLEDIREEDEEEFEDE